MSLQRRIGSQVRWLANAPGLLLAPFVLPTSVIIVLLVSSGLVVGLTIALVINAGQDAGQARPRRQHYGDALGPGASTCLSVVSLSAVSTISVAMALLLLLVLVLCSPTCRGWLQARFPRDRQADTPVQTRAVIPAQARPSAAARGPVDPRQLPSMTTRELCLAWRASYVSMQTTHLTSTRSSWVAWRHACLDEFESRHPEGLAAWLDSGARAASGPDRFLPHGPDRAA